MRMHLISRRYHNIKQHLYSTHIYTISFIYPGGIQVPGHMSTLFDAIGSWFYT